MIADPIGASRPAHDPEATAAPDERREILRRSAALRETARETCRRAAETRELARRSADGRRSASAPAQASAPNERRLVLLRDVPVSHTQHGGARGAERLLGWVRLKHDCCFVAAGSVFCATRESH